MQNTSLQSTDIYTNISSLNALRNEAKTNKGAALKEVAKQFESMFISQMLKSMRKANEVFAQGDMLNSTQTQFYQQMFDSQLALTMSHHGGIGLAKVLERQLSKTLSGNREQHSALSGMGDGTGTASKMASIQDYPRTLPALSPKLTAQLKAVDKLVQSSSTSAPESGAHSGTFSSPQDFVNQLLPLAQKAGKATGVDPRVLIAQAALETGWGQHMITGKDGTVSHNLFGIKANDSWSGPSVKITTTEYRDGKALKEVAPFRAYDSYAASFQDYVKFLQGNPRYQAVLQQADDPEAFTGALQEAGYATDPSYSRKIQSIMGSDSMRSALDGSVLSDLSLGSEE